MSTTVQDDYLVCSEYKEQINNKSAENPGFITFQHQNGNHYFAWVNGDEIVMRSEAYPDAEKTQRGINAILKNCDLVERYSVIEEHGAHLLLLWGGGDHQKHTGNRNEHSEIGRSCPHKTREELNALLQFKGSEFANKVVPIAGASTTASTSSTGIAAAAVVTGGLAAAASSISSTASAATSTATSTVRETAVAGASTINSSAAAASGAAAGSMGWLKWLLPVLLGVGAYLLWKNYNSKDAAVTPAAEVKTETTVPGTDTTNKTATVASVPTATKESLKVKLADGSEIDAFKGGIEDRMVTFLNDKSLIIDSTKKGENWYDFDNLNFEFGKTTITKESLGQIGNIVAILKAYPNTKMKIGAYTDKKGNDAGNMKLSQARADAVLAAIKAAGGNVAQITKAEGYGETLAVVAETASDEERLKDRRTSIKIVSK
jgi:outer membrane protein OmpA-like peptidoglycan-associated protein